MARSTPAPRLVIWATSPPAAAPALRAGSSRARAPMMTGSASTSWRQGALAAEHRRSRSLERRRATSAFKFLQTARAGSLLCGDGGDGGGLTGLDEHEFTDNVVSSGWTTNGSA